MHDLLVCWGAPRAEPNCAHGICVQKAPIPSLPAADPMGFRCSGSGADRYCLERSHGVGRFECQEGRCEQRFPRMPSDGEWTCADLAGATVCYGGIEAAGVVATGRDTSWFCGERRSKNRTEQVCVDLSPDYPVGKSEGYRCRYEWDPEPRRICEQAADVHQLGDACDPSRPCVDGAVCVVERCVPPKPEPRCIFDADCKSGACRFGSCRKDEE